MRIKKNEAISNKIRNAKHFATRERERDVAKWSNRLCEKLVSYDCTTLVYKVVQKFKNNI